MKIEISENDSQTSCLVPVYSMDLMLAMMEKKLEAYRKGNEHLEDYEIDRTLTDFQCGCKYNIEMVIKYIKEEGMWHERLLRS